jgi:Flp pilus assembly protein TadB
MSTDVQINEYGEVTPVVPVNGADTESIVIDDTSATESTTESVIESATESTTESAAEIWQLAQTFFADATSSTVAFFRKNQSLLIALGWILLAFLGARLLFAALDAVDDIPLVTPILKLIGLVYAVRFVWRYLIREQNRQELVQTFNQTKAEVLGR